MNLIKNNTLCMFMPDIGYDLYNITEIDKENITFVNVINDVEQSTATEVIKYSLDHVEHVFIVEDFEKKYKENLPSENLKDVLIRAKKSNDSTLVEMMMEMLSEILVNKKQTV